MGIMARKNRKKASLGWFFWVAFILLVALLFFINKENIKTVMEKTNAKGVFQKKETKKKSPTEVDIGIIQNEIEKINSESAASDKEKQKKKSSGKAELANSGGTLDSAEKPEKKSQTKTDSQKNKDTLAKNNKKDKNKKDSDSLKNDLDEKNKKEDSDKKKKSSQTAAKNKPKKSDSAKKSENEKAKLEKEQFLKTKLFFVKVESDGKIFWKPVTRNLKKTDSPMTTALNSLLAGTTVNEAKSGLRSFIPPATRILSVNIEACQAQLAQIVFTACEFPTVDAVQFLIEGRQKQYLGGEGVFIGSPLSPASF